MMKRKRMIAGLAACLMLALGTARLAAEEIGDPDVSVAAKLFVGQGIGIGTNTPADELHISSSTNPGVRFQEIGTGGSGYLCIEDNEAATLSQGKFSIHSFTGDATIDYNPMARNGTSQAYFRLFRETNTTGPKYMMLYRGNGTSQLSAKIGIDGQSSFFGMQGGKVGIGTASPQTELDVNGEITTAVITITGGSDLSERFDIKPVGESLVTPGMVVSIDPGNPGDLVVSRKAYDTTVAGVVSGAEGLKPGMVMSQPGTNTNGKYPVALTGRVYCLCDATYGAIKPGDMLTTSPTAGHAMKVSEYEKAHGATIGKAMTSLESGQGMVLILVSLQ